MYFNFTPKVKFFWWRSLFPVAYRQW